jgi:hypothetical protein
MAEPFAELGDLEDRWKKLPEPTATRAINLLDAASRHIRQRVPSVDGRIVLDPSDANYLDPLLVTDVACDMVRRVLTTPANGVQSSTQQVGSTSVSGTYDPGVGGLRLLRSELELLLPAKQRGKAGSVGTLVESQLRAPGTEFAYDGARVSVSPYPCSPWD